MSASGAVFNYIGLFGPFHIAEFLLGHGPRPYNYRVIGYASDWLEPLGTNRWRTPVNPVLQALLEQFKNVKIDVPGLIADPEFPATALKVVELLLKHVKA